jgi:hypothetical protein
MGTIMPREKRLRDALRWMSERWSEEPSKSVSKLLEEATFRFNLSPREGEYLEHLFRKGGNGEEGADDPA